MNITMIIVVGTLSTEDRFLPLKWQWKLPFRRWSLEFLLPLTQMSGRVVRTHPLKLKSDWRPLEREREREGWFWKLTVSPPLSVLLQQGFYIVPGWRTAQRWRTAWRCWVGPCNNEYAVMSGQSSHLQASWGLC